MTPEPDPANRPRARNLVVLLAALAFAGALYAFVIAPLLRPKPAYTRTTFLSGMKMVHTAVLLYAGDSDDRLPVRTVAGTPSALGWAGRLLPYTKNPDVFRDPDDRTSTMSLALNANAADAPLLASVPSPARSLLLFEVADANADPKRPDELALPAPYSPAGDGTRAGLADGLSPAKARYATGALANSGLTPADAPSRLAGTARYVFADGHAGALPPASVSAGANARAPKAPATPAGCARPDGSPAPCAEASGFASTAPSYSRATFSLR